MAYFPMFIDITGADCLIVGGGNVAYRKAKVLLDFGAKVTVVAKKVSSEIDELSKENNDLVIEERAYEKTDLYKREIVVVATNDSNLNKQISMDCKEAKIPVNVVDDQDNCSFIFPSYVKEGDLVGAFSSSGKSPMLTQYLKDEEKKILTPELGALNDEMGKLRKELIDTIPDEENRKLIIKEKIKEALGR